MLQLQALGYRVWWRENFISCIIHITFLVRDYLKSDTGLRHFTA